MVDSRYQVEYITGLCLTSALDPFVPWADVLGLTNAALDDLSLARRTSGLGARRKTFVKRPAIKRLLYSYRETLNNAENIFMPYMKRENKPMPYSLGITLKRILWQGLLPLLNFPDLALYLATLEQWENKVQPALHLRSGARASRSLQNSSAKGNPDGRNCT